MAKRIDWVVNVDKLRVCYNMPENLYDYLRKHIIRYNELFGVVAPTLRTAIKAIYKNGTHYPVSTQRCDLAIPKSCAAFYNLEVVIALTFQLNTYEASKIRKRL